MHVKHLIQFVLRAFNPTVFKYVLAIIVALGFLPIAVSGQSLDVSGSVVDNVGNPEQGVQVTMDQSQQITTDANGSFSFSNVSPGNHTVSVPDGSGGTITHSVSVTSGSPNFVNFQRNTGPTNPSSPASNAAIVEGVVRDASTSTPLQNASVMLNSGTGGNTTAHTNGSGEYQLSITDHGGGGSYSFTAMKQNYLTQSKSISVTPNDTTTTDFDLEPMDLNIPPPVTGSPPSQLENVPWITWNNSLLYRIKNTGGTITIGGPEIADILSGNVPTNPLQLLSPPPQGFNFGNLSLQDFINGGKIMFNNNIPGVSVEGFNFYHDFYYDINASIDLRGNTYDQIYLKFYKGPPLHSGGTTIGAYPADTNANIHINTQVFNQLTNPYDPAAITMNHGNTYYIGLVAKDAILGIARLPTYIQDLPPQTPMKDISVSWSPPFMSVDQSDDAVSFNLEGAVQNHGNPHGPMFLKFGSHRGSFDTIDIYPVQLGQNFSFSRDFEEIYATTDGEEMDFHELKEGTLYYVGMYEGESLVSFMQAGRTPGEAPGPHPVASPGAVTTDAVYGGATFAATQNAMQIGGSGDEAPAAPQAPSGGLVPCDEVNQDCTFAQLIKLIENVIDYIFVAIIPIAAIVFAYAGGLLLFSGSNTEKRQSAKNAFMKVVIGVVIVMSAWLIVKTILTSLGVDTGSGYFLLSI